MTKKQNQALLSEAVKLLRFCASCGPEQYLDALEAVQKFLNSLPPTIDGQLDVEFLISTAGLAAVRELQAEQKSDDVFYIIDAFRALAVGKKQEPAAARAVLALRDTIQQPP